jgi:uroporphyrinogen-III synthase
MAVLITRPSSDNETTAARLRARGFGVVLAPVLRLEPATFRDDPDTDYSAVIVTSANALRAVEPQLGGHDLLKLPLLAVGEHTAEAARGIGFTKVMTAEGDAGALRDLVLKSVAAKRLKKGSTLLYLAGADVSRDLAGELAAHSLHVVTQTTYRMTPIPNLPRDACEAFAANAIDAVLHYSGRSARAFLDAARADGVEISALSVPQCCLSESVAAVLRDAGATQVVVAASPDENALLAALERALRSRLA